MKPEFVPARNFLENLCSNTHAMIQNVMLELIKQGDSCRFGNIN